MGPAVYTLNAPLLVLRVEPSLVHSRQLRTLVIHLDRLCRAQFSSRPLDCCLPCLLVVVVRLASARIYQLNPRHLSIYYGEKTSYRRSDPCPAPCPSPGQFYVLDRVPGRACEPQLWNGGWPSYVCAWSPSSWREAQAGRLGSPDPAHTAPVPLRYGAARAEWP